MNKGLFAEIAALRYLERNHPSVIWRMVPQFSSLDLWGADIVGKAADGSYQYVQVKSSEFFIRDYDPRIEVLVMADVPYFYGKEKERRIA